MKDIAIFGAGGLGRETAATLEKLTFENEEGWNLIGFYDDTLPIGYQVGDFGLVLGGIKELNELKVPLNLAICLGYPQNRAKIHSLLKNQLISYPNLIHKDFEISHFKSFKIGYGNLIQGGCGVTTDITIGNFNLLNGYVGFGHDVQICDYNVFMGNCRVSGHVKIGDRNLFGTNCYIMEKLKIGNDISVGPLSALLTKPKNGGTYIGNPAKIFKFK